MDLPPLPLPDFAPLGFLMELPDAVAAALVSAVATMALVAAFSARRSRHRAEEASVADSGISEFLIDGASVRPLTASARQLVESLAPGGTRLSALARHFSVDCPCIQDSLEALVLYGISFRHDCLRADGSGIEIAGQPTGGAARLSIRPASEDAQALRETRAALLRATEEGNFLRGVLDRAPVLAWSHGADGQVAWANAPYRNRFEPGASLLPDHRIADAFGRTIEEVPLTTRDGGSRRRVSVPGHDEVAPSWFEVSRASGATGEPLGFALDAGEIVAAEASLRRFVETLTETFAHLPIGLAVFDRNRRLGLFNPALTDLVKIDAVWLAGRPSLRDFLERLRETRQMPEQKDFASWRRKLGELEDGARDGTYEESWVLPSGKVFRVTGRPHPQGALALLFEDISSTIMLERKYRSELELSRATLDRLTEAVAVFDASGMLAFVNSAFRRLWQFDPMASLDGADVAEMTARWAERCIPSAVWPRIAEFATAGEFRTSWADEVSTRGGRRIGVLVAPLPDASALVVFDERSASVESEAGVPEPGDTLADIAIEILRAPVESAVQKLMSAIPSAPSAVAFQALTGAAQVLRDGLTRSDEVRAARAGLPSPGSGDPIPALASIFACRHVTLAVPPDASRWPEESRRSALALGLAAADVAEASATVTLALDDDGATLRATVRPAISGRTDGPGIALARRLVASDGGAFSIRPEGANALITVTAAVSEPAVRRSA